MNATRFKALLRLVSLRETQPRSGTKFRARFDLRIARRGVFIGRISG
jgi:hypothetical protein